MEDVTLTQLFERMDRHLAKQDDYLMRLAADHDVLLASLRESNAVLAATAQMLADTRREMAERSIEASRQAAANIRALEALADRLRHPEENA